MVLLRRFVIIVCVVGAQTYGAMTQIVLAQMAVVMFWTLNAYCQPYAHEALQSLEDVSLFSTFATLWGGLLLTISKEDERMIQPGTVMGWVFLVNIFLIVYAFYVLFVVLGPLYAVHPVFRAASRARDGGVDTSIRVFEFLYKYICPRGMKGYIRHPRRSNDCTHHMTYLTPPEGHECVEGVVLSEHDDGHGAPPGRIPVDVRTVGQFELEMYFEELRMIQRQRYGDRANAPIDDDTAALLSGELVPLRVLTCHDQRFANAKYRNSIILTCTCIPGSNAAVLLQVCHCRSGSTGVSRPPPQGTQQPTCV